MSLKSTDESLADVSLFRLKVIITLTNTYVILFERESDFKYFISEFNRITGIRQITEKYEIYPAVVGQGRFGVIKKGRNLSTGQIIAVKELNKQRIKQSEMLQTRREVDALKVCKHPNIVQLYDFFVDRETIFIVMEFCGAGDLFEYLDTRRF